MGLRSKKVLIVTKSVLLLKWKNKVNIRCVKKFHDKVDEIVVKSIRLSKACHTSFERESLHEVSKIKDLKHCTASYIGK